MGHVYEAVDARLNRTVAVKETLVETDELRRAFEREAHLLANLRHPVLPNVSDHFSEGGGLFLVMEFIPGNDLAMLLEGRGNRPFLAAEVLGWADALLDALEYLHTHHPPIVHRDIKPANLKLTASRQIILLDFGLAKGSIDDLSTVTDSRSILGYTPHYAPVEQIQGAGTDARSDLYALGATLYHLLTGAKPPDAVTRMTALLNQQPDPLAAPQTLNNEVSAGVAGALVRAMAINPDQRFASAHEMRAALRQTSGPLAVPVFFDPSETTVVASDADERTVTAGSRRQSMAPVSPQMVIPIPTGNTTTPVAPKTSGARVLLWPLAGLVLVALAMIAMVWYGLSGRMEKQAKVKPVPTQMAVNVNLNQNIVQPTMTPFVPTPQPTPDSAIAQARARLSNLKIDFTERNFLRAIDAGDVQTAGLFLDAGMKADAKTAQGRTALMLAAERGHNHLTQMLLEREADPDATDAHHSTALMEAAAGGHDETLKVLLDKRANVNLVDNDGQSALMLAAKNGHTGAVKMLLNAEAQVDLEDKQGRTALDWAEFNSKREISDLLRMAGAR